VNVVALHSYAKQCTLILQKLLHLYHIFSENMFSVTHALSIVARNRGHCRHPAKQRNNKGESTFFAQKENRTLLRLETDGARVSSGVKKKE